MRFIGQKIGKSKILACMKLADKELIDAYDIVETFAKNFAQVYHPATLTTTLKVLQMLIVSK